MESRQTPGEAASVAEAVRAFYEERPYPPPVDDLEKYRAWQDPQKRRAEYHLLFPSRSFDQDHSILVAGCGTSQAAKHAMRWPTARVTGIDFSETSVRCSEELKRRYRLDNLEVHRLPIEQARELNARFDHIVCTGVLHHLPDPEAAFQNLLRYLKPGGEIQIYLYWQPERRSIKSALLSAVNSTRNLTTRLPHWAVHALAYPSALAAFLFFVWPYQVMKRVPALRSVAANMPMKQYAVLPFRVCVNDQLDRFSAPIENRYTKTEVEAWLSSAGLQKFQVIPNFGWLGTGQKPESYAS